MGKNEKNRVNYNPSNPHWNNDTDTNTRFDPNHTRSANTIYFYLSSMPQQGDAALVACHLHNANYNVGFSFENSQSSIDVRSVTIEEAVPHNATVDIKYPNYGNVVYSSVLHAFNKIVVPAATNDTGTETPNVLYSGGSRLSFGTATIHRSGATSTKLSADAVIKHVTRNLPKYHIKQQCCPHRRSASSRSSGPKPSKRKEWHTVNILHLQTHQPLHSLGICRPSNTTAASRNDCELSPHHFILPDERERSKIDEIVALRMHGRRAGGGGKQSWAGGDERLTFKFLIDWAGRKERRGGRRKGLALVP